MNEFLNLNQNVNLIPKHSHGDNYNTSNNKNFTKSKYKRNDRKCQYVHFRSIKIWNEHILIKKVITQ